MNTTNILNGVTLASRDEVTEHTENATMHLTDEERNTWNAKADASALAGKWIRVRSRPMKPTPQFM